MTKDKTLKSPARRMFFLKAGTGVGVVSAAALGLGSGVAQGGEPRRDDRKAGNYRETKHVRTAYRLARF
jgi:hypothetical protein